MEDDVIAYLYPYGNGQIAKDSERVIKDQPRHLPPRVKSADTKLGRHDRESTDPPEDLSDSPFDRLPCLEIKFSDIPQTNRGLIFGSGENCDVPLRKDHVSRIHFSLTFDDLNRPLIKDLNSLLGTQVTYNGDGRGMRRDFQWIVGGHKTPDEMGSIVIELWRLLSFQIVIVPHQITSPEYIDKVRRFQQGTMTAEDAINALGLNVPLTRPLSGVHTPGVGEIRLETRLGEGSFGAVHHLWDVSTGAESVVKRPSERATDDARCDSKARRALLSEWHNEANIMSQVSHVRISIPSHLIESN